MGPRALHDQDAPETRDEGGEAGDLRQDGGGQGQTRQDRGEGLLRGGHQEERLSLSQVAEVCADAPWAALAAPSGNPAGAAFAGLGAQSCFRLGVRVGPWCLASQEANRVADAGIMSYPEFQ